MNRARIFLKSFWITIVVCLLLFPITTLIATVLMIFDRFKHEQTIFDFHYTKLKENMDSTKILKSLGIQRGFYYYRWVGVILLTFIMCLAFIQEGGAIIAGAVISGIIFIVWLILAIQFLKKILTVLRKSQDKLTNEEFTLWVKILNKIEIKDPKAIENLKKKLEQIELN